MDVEISSYRVDVPPTPKNMLTAYSNVPRFRTYQPCRATLYIPSSLLSFAQYIPSSLLSFAQYMLLPVSMQVHAKSTFYACTLAPLRPAVPNVPGIASFCGPTTACCAARRTKCMLLEINTGASARATVKRPCPSFTHAQCCLHADAQKNTHGDNTPFRFPVKGLPAVTFRVCPCSAPTTRYAPAWFKPRCTLVFERANLSRPSP
eukprot:365438-Chlamydomonas_euryale.AAC.12